MKKTRDLNIEEHIEKLLKEIRLLAKTNHPHVLRYYSCWFDVVYDKNTSQRAQKLSTNLKENEFSENEFEMFIVDGNDQLFKNETGFNEIFKRDSILSKPSFFDVSDDLFARKSDK